jgi:dTDP-4-amino-4,6-dideoxygalactose transaminase
MVLPSLELRTKFIQHLKKSGISAVFHYQALNSSPMGLQLGGRKGQCPVSENMSDRLVRLPFFNSMTEEEQERVVSAIIEFSCKKSSYDWHPQTIAA